MTAIPYEVNRSAIIERGVDAFIESTRRAVALQIQALHEMLLRKHSEATERVGNQIDAGGQPYLVWTTYYLGQCGIAVGYLASR